MVDKGPSYEARACHTSFYFVFVTFYERISDQRKRGINLFTHKTIYFARVAPLFSSWMLAGFS